MDEKPQRTGGDPAHGTTAYHAHLARGGDDSHFAILYERLAPAIHAWACIRIRPTVRSLVDPEDLVAETWCVALNAFRTSFDPAVTPFRPWLFGVANLVLMRKFRRVRGRLRAGPAAGAEDPVPPEAVPDQVTSLSRRMAREEGFQRFLDEIDTLPQEDRELMVLRGLEGLSHDEVAARAGISAAAARKRWERLRARLAASPVARMVLDDE